GGVQRYVELLLRLVEASGVEINRAEIAGGLGDAGGIVGAHEQIDGPAVTGFRLVGPFQRALGVAEIVDGVADMLGKAELLVKRETLLEMGGGLVEAGLLEQDGAEIE